MRGLCLTAIPLVGMLSLGRREESKRSRAIDKTVVLLILVLGLQVISAIQNLPVSYAAHALPAVALVILALAARADPADLSTSNIRTCLRAPVAPLTAILVLGWVAQLTHQVPSLFPSARDLFFHGHRLQGLAAHPNSFGFLAAMVAVLAFCAESSRFIWIARGVAVLSVIASESRTALLSMAAGLLLLWVLGSGWAFRQRVFAIAAAALVAPLAWVFINIHRATGTGRGDLLSGRGLIWANASRLVSQVGVLGDGPESIGRLFPTLAGPNSHLLEAQNLWINDAINFGYVTSALMAVLLVSIAVTRHRNYRQAVLIPLVGMVVVESFSEIPVDFWAGIVQAFPIFLLLLVCPRRSVETDPEPAPTWRQHFERGEIRRVTDDRAASESTVPRNSSAPS